METTKKLTGKDLINVGIYTAMTLVIFFVVGLLTALPVVYPFLFIIWPIVCGIPKPTVCALYPLGRVALFQDVKDKDAEITRENIRVKYIINDYNCGSAKKRNTVRSWLAQFQIPEEDEFFIRWNVVTVNLSAMVRKLEENNCSEHTLQMLWNAILFTLYVDYDTKEDFMPQFEKAEEYLLNLCRKFRDMTMDQRPDTDGAETAANDLEPVNV